MKSLREKGGGTLHLIGTSKGASVPTGLMR